MGELRTLFAQRVLLVDAVLPVACTNAKQLGPQNGRISKQSGRIVPLACTLRAPSVRFVAAMRPLRLKRTSGNLDLAFAEIHFLQVVDLRLCASPRAQPVAATFLSRLRRSNAGAIDF